ncbi:MAG: flavodoxin family protein [Gammaproteobacteria bacterium]|nr:flavodoxin family protein [Gammaproteobacteria bacterium]
MPDPQLTAAEFTRRFRSQFADPAFDPLSEELTRLARVAWDAYVQGRKSPRTRKAGPEFADPDYQLSVDWLAAREGLARAQQHHDDPHGPAAFLLINGSSRSEHTCPGESSKSWRLLALARDILAAAPDTSVEVLDLSRLSSEYGRHIHPCKACFSTAAALCHWPCSCYPNYSLGQTLDCMNDIYPQWVAAHAVMVVTPVNWFHVSSPLKLMMDRLVCADGGNPDPTSTHGKDARLAKSIELSGWNYPRPLTGRLFSCIVHGDAEGAAGARRTLCDWLSSLGLEAAGPEAILDRYIGYWQPYATSHEALDAEEALQEEVRNAARTLLHAVLDLRAGSHRLARSGRPAPRDK